MKNLNLLKQVVLIAILVCASGCSKADEEFCDCKNPIRQLDWLKEYISENKKTGLTISVYQTSYNTNEVFYIEDGSGLSSDVYDCSGSVLCSFGGWAGICTCSDFNIDTSSMELIWSNVDE